MKINPLAFLLVIISLALSNAYALPLTILNIHSTPTDNEKHEFNLSTKINQLGSSINPNLTIRLINDDNGQRIALH